MQGLSPYRRATYRYTPLLAWLLQGNVYITEVFGKVMFSACDILAAYIIYRLVKSQPGCSKETTLMCARLWLFNPLTLTVSTRGNAESIMAVLVLLTLLLLSADSVLSNMLGAVIYGISVHTKIYPATYALAIYVYLNGRCTEKQIANKTAKVHWNMSMRCLFPTLRSINFAFVSFLAFFCLTATCYRW